MPARRLAILAALGLLPAVAHADLLYSNTFESGVIGSGWSSGAHLEQLSPFSRFMGRFSNNTANLADNVTLTIPLGGDTGGHAPGLCTLSFDLYVIDSWEGDWGGPDQLQVSVNSSVLFDYTFSNTGTPQSYPFAPTVGPAQLGYAGTIWDKDSIYRNIQLQFDPGNANSIVINWRGIGLQNLTDESWGIDNVNVSSVPTPGSAALLGLGALTALRRKRR